MVIASDLSKRRLPAYLEVSQNLRERIEAGQYAPGEWLPAERDLAVEMKVSRPVIQAAFKHLREEGVLTQQGPGHRPRVSDQIGAMDDQGSPGPKSQTIVAIMSNGPGLVCGHNILHGINTALRETEAPYQLVIYDTDEAYKQRNDDATDPSWERKYLEQVERDGAAGVILFHSAGKETTPVIARIQQQGIPVVMIDRYSDDIDCDFVGTDNRSAAKAAVEHLIELGHRQIGYVLAGERVTSVEERLAGYRAALEANGIRYAPELVMSACSPARPALEYFSKMEKPPTAIFAVHDFVAFELIHEAEKMGIRTPEDLSIIGFDDIESYGPRAGILTTVRQPFLEIGRRAAELVLSRQSAPAQRANRHIFLPATLIVRSSSAAPRSAAKDNFVVPADFLTKGDG
jgi:DNA-binding LacI/PurR family transcriptional regulator